MTISPHIVESIIFVNFDKKAEMDIQTAKLELVKLIIGIDNKSIIDKLLSALKSENNDFWLDLSESEKQEIQFGIDQLDSGHRVSLDDFLKKVS